MWCNALPEHQMALITSDCGLMQEMTQRSALANALLQRNRAMTGKKSSVLHTHTLTTHAHNIQHDTQTHTDIHTHTT